MPANVNFCNWVHETHVKVTQWVKLTTNLSTWKAQSVKRSYVFTWTTILCFDHMLRWSSIKQIELLGWLHIPLPLWTVLCFAHRSPVFLEYVNVIWAPWYKNDIILTENVQRRAIKLVSNIRNYSCVDGLRKLNLPSLTYRRLRGDLIEVYK